MYVLVPLLAPVVFLGVMGMAWLEGYLLPPAEPPPRDPAIGPGPADQRPPDQPAV